MKTVLITGCSSGIGLATAKCFAANHWNVAATLRQPEKSVELAGANNVLVTKLDVQDRDSIPRAIEAVITRFGKIDALINNAGFSLAGVFESIPREKIQEQFDVNLFGVMDVTRTLLPHFRQNRSGLIVNVSSRAGLVGLPMNTLYCASKFALEGFTESLAYELAPHHIGVKLIEPSGGVSNTDFGKRLLAERAQVASPAGYEEFIARTSAAYAGIASRRMTSSDEVAQVIYAAATDGTSRLRYFCGEDTGDIVKARREMSEEKFTEFMRSRF
ncbi:MAG TPA: SDR family oxidoreductase [Candidatus Binatia bacterium]|nr:SDR family oxidoreductase [Candidatus Binatia bacterium]